MNESEIRREEKITKKAIDYIDRQLEELCKDRLIGPGQKADGDKFTTQEIFLALSKERRALIRMNSHSKKLKFESKE